MAVSTWLAIQQPPSLMRGAPGKELAGLNQCSGKISEWIPSTCAPEWNCEWERKKSPEVPLGPTMPDFQTSKIAPLADFFLPAGRNAGCVDRATLCGQLMTGIGAFIT